MRAQAPRNSTSLEALERLPSLSLSRWIVEGVALAVGRPARHQEAGDPGLGLGEDEEGVAHRRRAEPLVADQLVLGAGTAAVQRRRRGRVGAYVGAALLLGHRHPAEGAALALRRQRALVVVEREEALLPLRGQLGLLAQRRDRGVGHRDRAADAALGLHQQHEGGGAGDVGADARFAPGRRVQAVADPDPHQLVPGAVELDLVDAVAVAVVGAQLGLLLVCFEAPADRLVRAADRAQLPHAVLGPIGALAAQRLTQRPVGVEGVVVLQRRRLVEDLVGLRCGALGGCHEPILAGNRGAGQAEVPSGSGSGLITTVSATSRTSSAGMSTRAACCFTASTSVAW